ncbi:hypothetical protein PHISP_00769 [Aspergillus sp. HF37]|nr:hypothetical protein PHISP_00769 [Aspergillus sp. HF37]
MTDPIPTSYHQVLQRNQAELQTSIDHGVVKPLFASILLLCTCLPLSALLVPRRKGSQYVRPAIFVLVVGIAIDIIKRRRTNLGANGYMVGLITAWWVFWCGTLLVFNDVERHFKRIERRTTTVACNVGESEHTQLNGYEMTGDNHEISKDHRISSSNSRQFRGSAASQARSHAADSSFKQPSHQGEILTWQTYPQPFLHRLNWALGLLFNLRGPEWNWRISTLGPFPEPVNVQLNQHHLDEPYGPKGAGYPSPKARLTAACLTYLKSYLCLDVAKCVMMRDPYFWGVVSPSPPPPFPFDFLTGLPVLVRLYRLHVTAFGMISSMVYICSLNPITFLGLSLAFPKASRSLTDVPLDAPWLYSGAFGPFVVSVLDHGLAGCWGQWWHQLFRFGFTSPARWLLSLLPAKLASNSHFRRIAMALIAFLISGTLHACGSYTQNADTKPLSGAFLYFVVQAAGVMIQSIFSKTVVPKIYHGEVPRWLRRAANFVFAYVWLMSSGSLIADDFARGGVWLTEPIPVSPFRGLRGEGWWCWHGSWFRHFNGGSWWQSGVQVL